MRLKLCELTESERILNLSTGKKSNAPDAVTNKSQYELFITHISSPTEV